MSNTKTHLINPFLQANLNKSIVKENINIIEEKISLKPKTYLRSFFSLSGKQIVKVPRNNPHKRLQDFGIIPRSKYTLDVYLQIAKLFSDEKSPDQMVEYLHDTYASLKEARLSREFIKKALQLNTAVLVPGMINLVPKNGQWSLMIDGTSRAKDDLVLIIISAVPLGNNSNPAIIPLVTAFIPSENMKDVLSLLRDLKHRLPSLPKSIISDFRPGILDAISTIFPEAVSQGCHYHIIEMIVKILINPIIKKINKKISKVTNGLIRWAHHSIYSRQSENLMIIARTLKKLGTSNSGEFGNNFLIFCEKMIELRNWALKRHQYLKSDKNYSKMCKLLISPVWKEIKPLLSQLEFCLEEFTKLRKHLTMSQYKTTIERTKQDTYPPLTSFDSLIQSWIKLGEVSDNKFNINFKKSAQKLQNHYDLITPAILDPSLHRTTSLLENLNSQIKRFLRKWSGTKQLLKSFDWSAPLAAISRSLNETDIFSNLLNDVTNYDWVEKTEELTQKLREHKFQISFSNSIASKNTSGLVSHLDNLVMMDIIS